MYEYAMKLQKTLGDAKKYVQIVHDDAWDKVYTYGDNYMDDDLYKLMTEAETLLEVIDCLNSEDQI